MTPGADLTAARNVATELHRQGKLPEAQAAYAAYLAKMPNDSGILSNLGALFRSNGQYDLSLLAQERAFALAPNDRGIVNNLANILSDIGQYDRSIALRRKILISDPTDATNAKVALGGKP